MESCCTSRRFGRAGPRLGSRRISDAVGERSSIDIRGIFPRLEEAADLLGRISAPARRSSSHDRAALRAASAAAS